MPTKSYATVYTVITISQLEFTEGRATVWTFPVALAFEQLIRSYRVQLVICTVIIVAGLPLDPT